MKEKQVCKAYNLKPRKITENQIQKILVLLCREFKEVSIKDNSWECRYFDLTCCINLGGEYVIGTGWNLRDVVLDILLDERVIANKNFYDDLRWMLMSNMEKVKEIIFN